jgi:carbamoyl-phosphate synthase large subunit
VRIAREFTDLGFSICATTGTSKRLIESGIKVKEVFRLSEGGRPNIVDMIKNDEIQMTINIPTGMIPHLDENIIRAEAINHKVSMTTTLSGARAALEGIKAFRRNELTVTPLQRLETLRN